MLSREKKLALAVLLVVVVALAALVVGMHYMQPQPPTYAAVVDVKIYGPDWTIIAEDVGVNNATVLVALETAGDREGFSVDKTYYEGMGYLVTGINGTSGNMTHFWLYAVNSVRGEVGAGQKDVHTGDIIVWWYTNDFSSTPP